MTIKSKTTIVTEDILNTLTITNSIVEEIY